MNKSQLQSVLDTNRHLRHSSDHLTYWHAGTYCCNHGEYAQPDYRIAHRYHGEWGVKVCYYYYHGTINQPRDHWLTTEELADLCPQYAYLIRASDDDNSGYVDHDGYTTSDADSAQSYSNRFDAESVAHELQRYYARPLVVTAVKLYDMLPEV